MGNLRIALAVAILVISSSVWAASLTGSVVDAAGGYIPRASVELDSGTDKYRVQTDETGVYRFSNLPAGEYSLTIRVPGFKLFTLKAIGLTENEEKRIVDVPMDPGNGCGSNSRSLVLLQAEEFFGRLSGSVRPPAKDIEVILVCRTFSACRSTKTDAYGRFSFSMLSTGVYGLNFRREGYYAENATGYGYYVNAGWNSVYDPVSLQKCPDGNCDPKLKSAQIVVCE
jgi:hypothetical protein